jgi:hypothetical protein
VRYFSEEFWGPGRFHENSFRPCWVLVTVAGKKASSVFSSKAFYPEPVTSVLRERSVSPTSQCYAVATGDVAGAGVAAAFCGRLAATFFAAFREAFTGAFFTVFLGAGACWALAALAASALTLAQRLRVASPMAFLPAALSLRFVLGATGDGGVDSFLESAHRFRWASPMRFLAAALIVRLLPFGSSGAAAVSVGPTWSMARSSAI